MLSSTRQCILPWAQLCGEGWEQGPPGRVESEVGDHHRHSRAAQLSFLPCGAWSPSPAALGTSSRGGCSRPAPTLPLTRETTKPSPIPLCQLLLTKGINGPLIFITHRFPRKWAISSPNVKIIGLSPSIRGTAQHEHT